MHAPNTNYIIVPLGLIVHRLKYWVGIVNVLFKHTHFIPNSYFINFKELKCLVRVHVKSLNIRENTSADVVNTKKCRFIIKICI